ncbi:MAG: hypothetical protein EKK55_24295 [Rhodocyclaceae bacterium]|nr:MAG: hypothetical protein EKK55_24295 [Rhodocyclaceae bacterium]
MNIGATGDRIDVLAGILSGVEDSEADLIVPQLLAAVPGAPAEGKIKIITAGHMEDGGSATAYDVEPGETVEAGDPLTFDGVRYECKYARRYRFVPHEESRADRELPMELVTIYGTVMSRELLRNRDRKAIGAITGTVWDTVLDYSADAGAKQWSMNSAYPIRDLATVLDGLPMAPTHLVVPGDAWIKFATHPNVLSTIRWDADRAMLDQAGFQSLIGDKLGVRLVVQKSRVNNAGPLAAVTKTSLVRPLGKSLWAGTLASAPGVVRTDSRGRQAIVSEPTALAYVVEDELDYGEDEVINPRGREMTMGKSYAITAVSTALGARIDNIIA